MNVQTPTTELVIATEVAPTRKDARVVISSTPILDTAYYEHMQRIAVAMASTSMCPEALRGIRKGDNFEEFDKRTVVANCFMVVNQSVRWGFDPFAVAQSVSIVRGKLCYEGKLIAAVIKAKLGIRLKYKWDDKPGDALGIAVIGKYDDEDEPFEVEGTVGDWKTTGSGSPWTPKQSRKMLAYRGAREWCRLYAPELMLGVYTPDELMDQSEDARASRARPVAQVEHHEPPDPSEVEGGGKPAKPEKTEITTEQAVATVEAGRDDGKQVVWGDDDPPPPDKVEGDPLDIPPDLDRSPAGPILVALGKCGDMADIFKFREEQKGARAALSPADQQRVVEAVEAKMLSLMGGKP